MEVDKVTIKRDPVGDAGKRLPAAALSQERLFSRPISPASRGRGEAAPSLSTAGTCPALGTGLTGSKPVPKAASVEGAGPS